MPGVQSSLNIIHLGPGNVGKAFLRILLEQKKLIQSVFGIKIIVSGIVRSDKYLFSRDGLSDKEIKKVINKDENLRWLNTPGQTHIKQLMRFIPKKSVLLDTSASDKTVDLLIYQLERGGFAVVSNKKTLISELSDRKKFNPFQQSFFYETTVGAGLPVISTVKDMIESGDKIEEIEGCFSGTLGFIFSELEKGSPFSGAVLAAKELGYTEPDPRDDLSGIDVARKALILSRLLGKRISLKNIKTIPLYPEEMKRLSADEFLSQVHRLDSGYKKRLSNALRERKTLRYVAVVTKNKTEVSLKEVQISGDIGSLKGPDNIIKIRSERYKANPMIIKGPGAGIEVTAAGVFADLLKIIRILRA
ncbi:hypothetical protein A2866_05500 [Candidatus Roizmanbacteria bacterium RIFCSPHIGHO2_01_FULL_39_8]|uniref:Homoserine dehydrogenase n=3 Tax=Candidatus Roizmaniibacteriota TaxID=1752723 RepID=A0A1F7GFS3_9BACT|nr:MAG: hypothetical protein A2866_05500 [Candidatus Roizmanbacteria bacterium RIFCSPHIGHO2_01_FULL_39_8]OGK26584.1 MAG: hypothetical protein A3C28_03705 [Candidatus Roizmanbacteria bacterium RIFCSPHIGHO2_02_FULL_39_9]OGK37802.1 MAG: hypothetical protein A3F60_00030 [Candidatus Roizmanbacteria bacterium RIFCSPHIGHO2_12_FULL_39_8]